MSEQAIEKAVADICEILSKNIEALDVSKDKLAYAGLESYSTRAFLDRFEQKYC